MALDTNSFLEKARAKVSTGVTPITSSTPNNVNVSGFNTEGYNTGGHLDTATFISKAKSKVVAAPTPEKTMLQKISGLFTGNKTVEPTITPSLGTTATTTPYNLPVTSPYSTNNQIPVVETPTTEIKRTAPTTLDLGVRGMTGTPITTPTALSTKPTIGVQGPYQTAVGNFADENEYKMVGKSTTFADSFLPFKPILRAGGNESYKQQQALIKDYSTKHPIDSLVTSSAGSLLNWYIGGKLLNATNIPAAVAAKTGILLEGFRNYPILGWAARAIPKTIDVAMLGAGIAGTEQALSTTDTSAKSLLAIPGKATLGGVEAGLTWGIGGSFKSRLANFLGISATSDAIGLIETAIKNKKITTDDIMAIAANGLVLSMFDLLGGRSKTEIFKRDAMLNFNKDQTVSKIMTTTNVEDRVLANRVYDLIQDSGRKQMNAIIDNLTKGIMSNNPKLTEAQARQTAIQTFQTNEAYQEIRDLITKQDAVNVEPKTVIEQQLKPGEVPESFKGRISQPERKTELKTKLTPEEIRAMGSVWNDQTEEQDFNDIVNTVAESSDNMETFKNTVLGNAAAEVTDNAYIEPATLNEAEVGAIVDNLFKTVPEESVISLETGEVTPTYADGNAQVVVDEQNNIISGYQKLLDYYNGIRSGTKNTLPAIKVTAAGKVTTPTKNQIKLSEIYGGYHAPVVRVKRNKEQQAKTFRGQTVVGTTAQKMVAMPTGKIPASSAYKRLTAKNTYGGTRFMEGTYKGKRYTSNGYILEFGSDVKFPGKKGIQLLNRAEDTPTEPMITQIIPKDTKPIHLQRIVKADREEYAVFEDNIAMNRKYYDYFTNKYKDAIFEAKDNRSAVKVISGGEMKALVMPMAELPKAGETIWEAGKAEEPVKQTIATQQEKVKAAVAETPKTIKEVAIDTGILEPNVRRILGVGTKEGTFKRVEKGVYVLSKDGQDVAFIYPTDAREVLPKLADEGFKADMVFLDIPYITAGIKSANRKLGYEGITPEEFRSVVKNLKTIARTKDTPIFYMFSQSKTGEKDMAQYNKVLTDEGLKPIAKGNYTKVSAAGTRLTMPMRSTPLPPEGILLFSQSGKIKTDKPITLDFTLTRPRGYTSEKPAEMLRTLIELGTKEGDMVLDPFAGSGVAGAEAVKLGRYATLIENGIWYDKEGAPRLDREGKPIKVAEQFTIPRVESAIKQTDVVAKYPDINIKREVIGKDIQGNRITIPKGEALTPYELKGNKILIQDGESHIVSKNQFQNIKGNAVSGEVKPFAPELKGVEESVKGGRITRETLPDNMIVTKYDGRWSVYERTSGKLYGESHSSRQSAINAFLKEYSIQPTKFTQYQLPGGKNYKEILIKAPENKVIEITAPGYEKVAKQVEKLTGLSRDRIGATEIKNAGGSQELIDRWYNVMVPTVQKTSDVWRGKNFVSGHWEEPNVISHIRMNERTYNGKKVTFMEELQSDWAREGRKYGFVDDLEKLKQEYRDKIYLLEKKFGKKGLSKYDLLSDREEINKQINASPEYTKIKKELLELDKKIRLGVSNNPLLKNWQELSIKRALKEAVDNNSDYFVWINGEQTSARYNLSTQVKQVFWEKKWTGKEQKMVRIEPVGRREIAVYVDKNGIISDTIRDADIPNDWYGKKLNEVLGKGLADKIMETESGTLSGEDLKFGGEWATNLYDKQVGNIVSDLTGAKVETIDMGLPIDPKKSTWYEVGHPADLLKPGDIRVGQIINDGNIGDYIVTDIIGDGKFMAIPAEKTKIKELGLEEYAKRYPTSKIELNIAVKKSAGQSAIKITPEIRAIVKGEVPPLKKASGRDIFNQPNIVRGQEKPKESYTGLEKTLNKALEKTIVETEQEAKLRAAADKKAKLAEMEKERQARLEAARNATQVKGTDSEEIKSLKKRIQDLDDTIMENFGHPSNMSLEMERIKLNNRLKELQYRRSPVGIASSGGGKLGNFELEKTDNVPETQEQQFKIFEQVKELVKKYARSIGEDYLPRKAIGVYYPDTTNIRIKGMNHLSVAAHEITHFLDFKYKISDRLKEIEGYSESGNPIYSKDTAKLRKQLTDIYVDYYPGAKRTHSLKKRMIEGFATLLQKNAELPSLVKEKYPDIVNEFLTVGGKFYEPIMSDIIRDLKAIVQVYKGLSALDKIGSRIISSEINSDKDSFLNFRQKFKTEVLDNIYPLEMAAKMGKVWMTKEDPSLRLRMYKQIGALIHGNLTQKIHAVFFKDTSYWGWRNGEYIKLHDFNWYSVVSKMENEKVTDKFASWLVARTQYFSYKELAGIKKEVDKWEAAIEVIKKELALIDREESPEEYATARRAFVSAAGNYRMYLQNYRELMSILDKDGFTEQEVTEAYSENKDAFAELASMFDTLVREDLNFLHDETVGLVNDAAYLRLATKTGYASLKRYFYDDLLGGEEDSFSFMNIGSTRISSMIARTGSQKPIINPVFSAVKNHAEITRKGMRQMVYNSFGNMVLNNREVFKDVAQKIQLKTSKGTHGEITFKQEKDPKIIMARINYKRVPIAVAPTIRRTLSEVMTPNNISVWEEMFLKSSRFFTKSTTGTFVGFTITNFTIDQVTVAAQSRNKVMPIYGPLSEMYKALIDTDNPENKFLLEYLNLGGERQTLVGWQDKSADEFFKSVYKETKALDKVGDALNRGVEILATPSQYSEILTRAAEYIRARKDGKDQLTAWEQAGRVTAPFHHIGRWGKGHFGQLWIRSIPYLNAQLQVLSQTAESLETKSGRKQYAVVVSMLTAALFSGLGSIIAFGSDEQKKQYIDLKPNELVKYIWYPKLGGHGLVKWRIPDQMAFLGVLVNMAWANKTLGANYTPGEYIDTMTSWLPSQVNVFNPEKIFLSLLPQFLKIPTETILGVKDFPDIQPIESTGQKYKAPEFRYNSQTTPVAKLLGKELGMSPLKIDFFISGMLGRTSTYFTGNLSALDIVNPTKVTTKDYYWESGRKLQSYYKRLETNNQLKEAYKNKRKPFTTAEIRDMNIEAAKLKVITNYLDDYNKIDEVKEPERLIRKRDTILSAINKLD